MMLARRARFDVVVPLLVVLMAWPFAAAGESGPPVDASFAALKLASVPLPGSVDEVVVDEEQSLEVFLSPSDFPDALVRLTLSGVSADYALNLDLSTLRGEAFVERVQWPELSERPLTISVSSQASAGIPLAPAEPRPQIDEETLADQELLLEWYVQPEEGEPDGPLRGRVRAVRLSTAEDQTLATWIAPPLQEGCLESYEAGGPPRCHVGGVSRAVRGLDVDISGQWVAVAGGDLRPRVDVWELSSFALSRRIAFPPWQGPPLGVAYTPDGRFLVVVDGVGAVHLWNATSGGEHRRIETSAQSFAILDSGRLIAVAEEGEGITLWRTGDGTVAARLGRGAGRGNRLLRASGDGQRLAALRHDEEEMSLVVWQVEDGQVVGRIRGLPGIVDVRLDGAGAHLLATHDEQGLLRARVAPEGAFEAFGGAIGRRCRGHLAVSPDATLVACTIERGFALLDVERGRLLTLVGDDEEHGRVLDTIDFSPDGTRLLATGSGELLEWPMAPREGGR